MHYSLVECHYFFKQSQVALQTDSIKEVSHITLSGRMALLCQHKLLGVLPWLHRLHSVLPR